MNYVVRLVPLAVAGIVFISAPLPAGDSKWILSAERADDVAREGNEKYWVGLRNGADRVATFCARSLMYELDDPKGPSRAADIWPTSPHLCEGDDSKHRLLPGETYYWLVTVPAGGEPPSFRMSVRTDVPDGAFTVECVARRP